MDKERDSLEQHSKQTQLKVSSQMDRNNETQFIGKAEIQIHFAS